MIPRDYGGNVFSVFRLKEDFLGKHKLLTGIMCVIHWCLVHIITWVYKGSSIFAFCVWWKKAELSSLAYSKGNQACISRCVWNAFQKLALSGNGKKGSNKKESHGHFFWFWQQVLDSIWSPILQYTHNIPGISCIIGGERRSEPPGTRIRGKHFPAHIPSAPNFTNSLCGLKKGFAWLELKQIFQEIGGPQAAKAYMMMPSNTSGEYR